MKPVFITLFLLMGIPLLAQDDLSGICKNVEEIAVLEQQRYGSKLNFRTNPLTQDYDLVYHRFFWEVDPAVHYIKGSVTSYFIAKQKHFNRIHFDLLSNMVVNDVQYHGKSIDFEHGEDLITIPLPNSIDKDLLDSITVYYEGAPESAGFGSFAIKPHQGAPALWTLSEPYGAKSWWPCKQDLEDKIDSVDIVVKVPEGNKVGTNGVLKKSISDAGYKTYYWKHRYPISTYLISIAVSNYAEFSDYVPLKNGDSIQILNYVYPEYLETAETEFELTVAQMDLFNRLFGDYPFADEKYGHAQFGWGGGMEHQTMSSMGGFSFNLQAHELAHQWFGDKITCGSWEDIWLNEGFATYLSGLAKEFIQDEVRWNNWKRNRVAQITSQTNGSVWVNDTTSVGRIFNGRLSYNKGAYLLHMLRGIMGDEDFFQACRNYLNDPELAFGYARTKDLQWHLEEQSGIDFDEFFKDWYKGEGYPMYSIIWDQDDSHIQFQVNQKQSHPSVDYFDMPLPIRVYGETDSLDFRLKNTYEGQVFEFEKPFEIQSISFDPDLWLISKDNKVEKGIISSVPLDQLKESIKIFPNPLKDQFVIHFNEDLDGISQVKIFNASGELMRIIEDLDSETRVDVSKWSSGMYFVEFIYTHGSFTKSITKIE